MNRPSAKWARRYLRKHRPLIATQVKRQATQPQPKSRDGKLGQA
jgi:hypothetical protein